LSLNVSNESNQKLNIMSYYNGIPEGILILIALTLFVATPLFLAWYFIRRAKFKEKVTLIEKGIDVKDLNLIGENKQYSPWLRIGLIITGTALGALLVTIVNFKYNTSEAVILLFTGVSVILAYLIDAKKT
jgi:uncharacterized membrane protein YedE/YeeE